MPILVEQKRLALLKTTIDFNQHEIDRKVVSSAKELSQHLVLQFLTYSQQYMTEARDSMQRCINDYKVFDEFEA